MLQVVRVCSAGSEMMISIGLDCSLELTGTNATRSRRIRPSPSRATIAVRCVVTTLPSSSVRVHSMLSRPENGFPATGSTWIPSTCTRVPPSGPREGSLDSCAVTEQARSADAANTSKARSFIRPPHCLVARIYHSVVRTTILDGFRQSVSRTSVPIVRENLYSRRPLPLMHQGFRSQDLQDQISSLHQEA